MQVVSSSSGMSLNEVCARCNLRPAVRLLGTVAHCDPCAQSFLEPLRAHWGDVRAQGRTVGGYWLSCACGASWVGQRWDPCPWCINRHEQATELERAHLLHPHWLERSDGNPTYDSLDPINQEVWDRTRGQRRGEHSAEVWARRLARAVSTGLVTDDEARKALSTYGPTRSL